MAVENNTKSKAIAQDFVPVKEIRSGTVVMDDGKLNAVLMVSSLNFALKSGEEQAATIRKFQGFLNSLEFPTQISVQSRRLDIRPYLATLEDTMKNQDSDLIKIQTGEYINFIKNFTEQVNIMEKTFFVVVSYSPASVDLKKSGMAALFGGGSGRSTPDQEDENFEEAKTQLEQRVNLIVSGLSAAGIRLVRLGSEEVIEILYKIFNPGESDKPIAL